MTYEEISQLAFDNPFLMRVTSCAASLDVRDPMQWAQNNIWLIAAKQSSLTPSDADILSAVSNLIDQTPPSNPLFPNINI